MLADMATQIAAAQVLIYKAARSGRRVPRSAEAAQAKIFTSEMAIKVDQRRAAAVRRFWLFAQPALRAHGARRAHVHDRRRDCADLRTVVASRLLGCRLPQTRDGYLNPAARD